VVTTFEFEAIHHWPGALDYLAHPHRHLFKVTVKLEVKHDDREIEFIRLKHQLQEFARPWSDTNIDRPAAASCERFAYWIIDFLVVKYGADRAVIVEVMEDGENGGLGIYEPTDQNVMRYPYDLGYLAQRGAPPGGCILIPYDEGTLECEQFLEGVREARKDRE
jgi:6-pyruvoyl-tetrahydropterin synthase